MIPRFRERHGQWAEREMEAGIGGRIYLTTDLQGDFESSPFYSSGEQEQLEIKFRLHDGSDIGPEKYPAATSVATLKESILAQWPKEKENGPRTVNDLKLINAGKILDNNNTLGECKSPICDFSGGVTTMHVVVRPPSSERGSEKKSVNQPPETKCGCVIL